MIPILEMDNLQDTIPADRVLEIGSIVNDFAADTMCLTQREIILLEELLEKAYVAGREDRVKHDQ